MAKRSYWGHCGLALYLLLFQHVLCWLFHVLLHLWPLEYPALQIQGTCHVWLVFSETSGTYFFLTILPNYLISPMGSVTVLPDPAETIALIRTPPDYGFISIYSLFLIMPTCCVVCGTCLFVSKDESVHDACASTYNSALACTICLVSFVVLLVIHAYMTMGNIFFIDWKFQLYKL